MMHIVYIIGVIGIIKWHCTGVMYSTTVKSRLGHYPKYGNKVGSVLQRVMPFAAYKFGWKVEIRQKGISFW